MTSRLIGAFAVGFALASAVSVPAQTGGTAPAASPTAPPPQSGTVGGGTAAPAATLGPPATSPATITAPPVAPTLTPEPRGRKGGRPPLNATPTPEPSDTPAPPQFSTLDGVWEIEMQTRAKTFYSHITLKQSGDGGTALSGTWVRDEKKIPVAGTFDGRLFKITATDATTDYTLNGYIENFSDMVGLITTAGKSTPFTAQHRKKERVL
jgi:hypothetical protein